MMYCVPPLTSPVIPGGRVAASAQPVLPAGGGLILRPWRPADAPAVAAAYADPAIQRWHARRVDSEDEARDLILGWQGSWASETGAHWAVTRDKGGDVLGRMSLRWMALDEGRAECAYWTAPSARGTGVAPHGAHRPSTTHTWRGSWYSRVCTILPSRISWTKACQLL